MPRLAHGAFDFAGDVLSEEIDWNNDQTKHFLLHFSHFVLFGLLSLMRMLSSF
jgi:hypothetical protein